MKKLLAKIKNKKLKGNVSLLVIFVLLASSVISLLSINQIQRLITYGNMTFNYFRAFYIAKAWTELWLTEVYYREAWFEHSVSSGDSIVTENLIWIYTWFNPYFNMNISWNFQYLTNDIRYTNECSGDNKITLGSWEWIMLSLFTDETSVIDDILTGTKESNIEKYDNISNVTLKDLQWEKNTNTDKVLTFWLFSYDGSGNMTDIVVVETWGNKLDSFLENNSIINNDDKRKYLTIKNPRTWDEVVKFCVHAEWNLIPYSDSLISVQANYGDMEVWLQSVVKKWAPDWTLNVLGDPTASF